MPGRIRNRGWLRPKRSASWSASRGTGLDVPLRRSAECSEEHPGQTDPGGHTGAAAAFCILWLEPQWLRMLLLLASTCCLMMLLLLLLLLLLRLLLFVWCLWLLHAFGATWMRRESQAVQRCIFLGSEDEDGVWALDNCMELLICLSMQSRLGPSDPRPARSSRQGRLQQPSHEHSTELLPPPIGHKQTPEDVPHLVFQPPVPPVRPPEDLVMCLDRAVIRAS